MEETTTSSGANPETATQTGDANHPHHAESTGEKVPVVTKHVVHVPRVAPVPIPIVMRGQKYVPASGRHSQQTHRRALERAAAHDHTTEKEQHAHDRQILSEQLNRQIEQRKQQQSEQGRPKGSA